MAGKCKLDGQTIHGPAKGARHGLPESTCLFPWLTVIKNVEFGHPLQGKPAKEATERARHYVNAVSLSNFETAYPNQPAGVAAKQRCRDHCRSCQWTRRSALSG